MGFIIYDIIFLCISMLLLSIFFFKKKKNFAIEGWMYLYRTKIGLKLMDWFGKKHAAWLRPVQYAVISIASILMIAVIWLITQTVYLYIKYPIISQVFKAPPIFPIFPYFTEFFGLSSFFPPFYFTYFIIAISIVAVSHEFAHGIFCRLHKIRLKSTGFGFLRLFKIPLPILGAFVEQNDKDMNKASKTGQLAVLGAGVFMNTLLSILFLGLLWILFLSAFQPSGVVFNDYVATSIGVSQISLIGGIDFQNASEDIKKTNLSDKREFIEIKTGNATYYTTLEVLKLTLEKNISDMGVYENTPAFKSKLRGIIVEIDGKKMSSKKELSKAILSHNPNDTINIKALYNGEFEDYEIVLSEREGKAYLGINSFSSQKKGLMIYINYLTPKLNNYLTGVYYESKIGDFGIFIFNLLWWIVILNILVALFNMLPAGIFDGGRFFMISVWAITGKKQIGEKAFKWATTLVGLLFLALMIQYFINLI